MSELISGKDALIALANGEEVEFYHNNCWSWVGEMIIIKHFVDDSFQFRLKPRTITINGIEVPAPFEPKEGEACCFISDESVDGYHTISYNSERYSGVVFGLYRPSDIEQVVAALREVFK